MNPYLASRLYSIIVETVEMHTAHVLSLIHILKTVAERRENMLWFRTPEKVYFKKGCMPVALDELGTCLLYTSRCV